MSGAKNRFTFRLDAEGAQQVVGAFRSVQGQSDELNRAYQRLIQSSPQLASVNDNVQRKMRETATAIGATDKAAAGAKPRLDGLAESLGVARLAGAGLGVALGEGVRQIILSAETMERLGLRTEAVLKATGGAAGLSAEQVRGLAQSLAATTLATAQGAEAAAQKLLTFRSISGETFTRALAAAQDLAAVGFGGLESTIVQVGKALENPKEGISALTEVGVTFTEAQKKVIEQLIATGQAAKAQGLLLEGIEQQVGGAGRGEAGGLAGSYNRLTLEVQKFLTQVGNAGPMQAAQFAIEQLEQSVRGLILIYNTARSLFGGGTDEEKAVDRVTQAQRRYDAAAANDDPRNRDPSAPSPLSEARDDLTEAVADLQIIRDRAARTQNERERLAASVREQIASDTRAGERDKLTRDLDKDFAIRRKHEETVARIKANVDDPAESTRLITLADKERDDALGKLTPKIQGAAAATREHSTAIADMLKQRAQITADAEAVAMSLQPYASAWSTAADQVRKLTDAIALWESSAGAQGIDPTRGFDLIAQVQDKFRETTEGVGRATESTSRTFEQFFANATSGFEQAIVSGKNFGDVLKAIEVDLARVIIRAGVTGPLSDAIGGFVKGQGGASGIFQSIAGFFGFADGGIMTGQGPLPLRRYAGGGIANSPQLAMFGEGSKPEAYVPLPDGHSIPVTMTGGGGGRVTNVTVNVNNSNASPQLIAATVELSVRRANAEQDERVNRGGAAAKTYGRRG